MATMPSRGVITVSPLAASRIRTRHPRILVREAASGGHGDVVDRSCSTWGATGSTGGGVINGAFFFSIFSTASTTSGDGAGDGSFEVASRGAVSCGPNAAAIACVGSNDLITFAGTPTASE